MKKLTLLHLWDDKQKKKAINKQTNEKNIRRLYLKKNVI